MVSSRGNTRGGKAGGGKFAPSKASLPPSLQHNISGYASLSTINSLIGHAVASKKSSQPLYPVYLNFLYFSRNFPYQSLNLFSQNFKNY